MAALVADFSLLEGRFTAQEAKKVLHLLTDAKLRYHTERIITSSNDEEILQSKSRIQALKMLQQRINDFIDSETRDGRYITLHSVIQMEVLESEGAAVYS
ncbi:MAG: hypothetical protein MUC87_07175 [Bacteroidia bacterium]|jgi:hypothetical protein|nr:hypothetical protein [Bacteroidia bacterium]